MDAKRIENKFKSNDDYTTFDSSHTLLSHLLGFKQKVFNACGLLVPTAFMSPIAASSIVFCSFLQVLSMILSLFYHDEYALELPFKFLEYLRIYPVIEVFANPILYASCFGVFAAVLILFSANTIFNCWFHTHGYFSNLLPLLYWVGLFPAAELLISPWKCGSDFIPQCFTVWHFLLIGLSCLLAVLWVLLLFVSTTTAGYTQLYKHDPFAHFPWGFEVFYALLRLILLLELKFLEIPWLRLVTLIFFTVYVLQVMWQGFPYYNPTVAFSFVSGLGCILVGVLIMFLRYWSSTFGVILEGDVKLVLIGTGIVIATLYWKQKKWYGYLLSGKGTKTVFEIDARLHLLINAITEGIRFTPFQEFHLEMHEQLHKKAKENEVLSINPAIVTLAPRTNQSSFTEIETQEGVLADIFSDYEAEKILYKENIPFLIQIATAYLHLKKNPQLSYTTLLEVEQLDPGWHYQFLLHMLRLEILTAVSRQTRKNSKRTGQSNRFEQVIQFEAEYNNMRKTMTQQTTIRMDFWSSLRNKPSLNMLHKLGLRMINLNRNVRESWGRLTEIYPQHIGMLRLYKSYYKNIVGDKEETNQIRKLIKRALMEKSSKWHDDLFSDKTAILIARSDQKIIRASRNTESIFMYNQERLQGRIATTLMPRIISSYHYKFIEEFYKRGTTSGNKIDTYGVDRDGYIIPIKVAKKQFYTLTLGMLYIASIETTESSFEEQCIITDSKGVVGGITHNLSKRIKLIPSAISDKKMNINKLCATTTGEDILGIEGDVVLKFKINPLENKTSRIQDFLEESLGGTGSASPKNYVSRTTAEFIAKCEVSTIRYSSGLMLKKIKVGKEIENGEGVDKKKHRIIATEMIDSVSVILKAIRKFRALAIRGKKKRDAKTLDDDQKYPTKLQFSDKQSQFAPKGALSKIPTLLLPLDRSRIADASEESKEGPLVGNSPKNVAEPEQSTRSLLNISDSAKGILLKAAEKLVASRGSLKGLAHLDSIKLNQNSPTESKASGRALREITNMRKKNVMNFHPASIKSLKIITELFISMILLLLGIRMGVSVWLNTKVVDYAPLMHQNGARVFTTGYIGLCTEELILLYNYSNSEKVLLDTEARMTRYDYADLLVGLGLQSNITTYKEFLINYMRYNMDSLVKAQRFVDSKARKSSTDSVNNINPPAVTLVYEIDGKESTSTMPLRGAIMTTIANSVHFLEDVVQDKYDPSSYRPGMIIDNAMSHVLKWLRLSLDFIVADAYNQIALHQDFSLGALITLVGLYVLYFLILIPFLLFTSKDLESMLMLFLEISKQDIRSERDKTVKFMKKLYKEARMKEKEIAFEDNDNMLLENEEEEGKDGNLENENGDKDDKSPRNKGKTRSNKAFIPYKSNVWKVLFLFGFLSCCAIGVYFALDYFSKKATVVASFEIAELRYLSRNNYANAYNIPYLYQYILSNKTGVCGTGLCAKYLPKYFQFRLEELTTMLQAHKGNSSLLTEEYNKLYYDIMEGNPCENSVVGKQKNCSTLLGGVFKQGAFAANIRFADVSLSIFKDFENSNGTIEEIERYINDPRLIDLDMLNMELLNSAYDLAMNYILTALPKELKEGIMMTLLLLSLFVAIFMTTTLCWLVWLLKFMRRSMFDTKSLLSNLPDDVIVRNKAIYRYLVNASTNIDVEEPYNDD